ncbi:MAG: hypothetical protein HPY61_05365 [Methanotrichaceae archaeon]|nr:hypothetical protein [Methanotrichaceae archaeon]
MEIGLSSRTHLFYSCQDVGHRLYVLQPRNKYYMKRLIAVALVAMLVATMFVGAASAGIQEGPAPNSGDGVPDGSGMDDPLNENPGANSPGPAPNSGNGVSDGSGF